MPLEEVNLSRAWVHLAVASPQALNVIGIDLAGALLNRGRASAPRLFVEDVDAGLRVDRGREGEPRSSADKSKPVTVCITNRSRLSLGVQPSHTWSLGACPSRRRGWRA